MNSTLLIHSEKTFVFEDFLSYMEIPNLVIDFTSETLDSLHWYFHREGQSTTLFALNINREDMYEVSIDNLASYEDLKFFPYLVDSLAKFLNGKMELGNIYEELNEEWIEETIAEEIANLKASLTILPQYFIAQPMDDLCYVSLEKVQTACWADPLKSK